MTVDEYFKHFETLPKELRDLINEYGDDAAMVWSARAVSWRSDAENKDRVLFALKSKRSYIQNYILNEALGTQNW